MVTGNMRLFISCRITEIDCRYCHRPSGSGLSQMNFGKVGPYYYWIARGVDHRRVKPDRIRKSVGGENTFFEDVDQFDAAKEKLGPIIEKVWRHADAKGLYGKTLTLKVKFADFEQITRSRTGPKPLTKREEVERIAHQLLEPIFPVSKGVRLLGISLSAFGNDAGTDLEGQLSLSL